MSDNLFGFVLHALWMQNEGTQKLVANGVEAGSSRARADWKNLEQTKREGPRLFSVTGYAYIVIHGTQTEHKLTQW